MAKKKPSIGRQKIKIEKIPKKNHLQVTFSKRRAGLFKKASELCTLCGVEIAITVFSPANKAFSFGHPDVDSIINRFVTRIPPPNSGANQLIEAHRNAKVRDLNLQLTQILNQLEAEKKHGEALNQMRKTGQSQFWWEAPIEELGTLFELEQLRGALEELQKMVVRHANKILNECTNSLPLLGVNGIGTVDLDTKPEINSNNLDTKPEINSNNFRYSNGVFLSFFI